MFSVIKESLKRIETTQVEQWKVIDEHSKSISNVKGWVAGVVATSAITVGILKLF